MNSLDFRSALLEKLRAFDSWAWKDSRDNPQDYEGMDFWAWFDMFKTYLENDK